jgi:hypothetical protein
LFIAENCGGAGVRLRKAGLLDRTIRGTMAQRVVQTSKRLSAERQIHAAIAHFHAGDFECAITLCSAVEGQMPPSGEPTHLFQILQDYVKEHPA